MASQNFSILKTELKQLNNKPNANYSSENSTTNKYIIEKQPISYFESIYTNTNFKEYVKYAFVAKKYQVIIDKTFGISLGIVLVLSILLYLLFHNIIVSIIFFAVLAILLMIANATLTKGESYNDFYNRTVYDLIFSILPGYTVNINKNLSFIKEDIERLVKFNFDSYQATNSLSFHNDYLNGELYNLILKKEKKTRNSDGNYTTSMEDVFNGFSITLNYKNSFNFLQGAIIKIRDDDNFLSAISEDTIQSIYQSDKEFMFNSEELNKAFDCFIGGTNAFNDIDALMQKIHMVITPMFEEQLLFLKNRFNTFNMTITDNMINFNVSMSKSSFQKAKSGELLSMKTKYRDHVKEFRLPLSGSLKATDFMYYRLFPPAERLFYVTYFDNMIQSYLNKENIKIENFDLLKAFQTEDLATADTEYKEFKMKYEEMIENVYEQSKMLEINLKESEIYGKNN